MTHSLIEVLLSLLSSYRVLRFTFLVPHVFPRVRSFRFAFSPSTFTSTPASTVSLTATWLRLPLPMYSLHSHLSLQSILFWAIVFLNHSFLELSSFLIYLIKLISWNCYSVTWNTVAVVSCIFLFRTHQSTKHLDKIFWRSCTGKYLLTG